jgi:hypothetical protein
MLQLFANEGFAKNVTDMVEVRYFMAKRDHAEVLIMVTAYDNISTCFRTRNIQQMKQ